jgi:hypothetical protein
MSQNQPRRTLGASAVNSRTQSVRSASITHPNEASSFQCCDPKARWQGRIAVESYPCTAESERKEVGCLNPVQPQVPKNTFFRAPTVL